MNKRGLFITFEGCEGCGKSTQSKRLVEYLRSKGYDVLTTREPGGTPTGEAIRNILQHDAAGEAICAEAETLLFEASRAQLVRNVIRPAIEHGTIVISDRFADSTTAYQGYGRGFDIKTLLRLHDFAMAGMQPDVTILMDVDIEEGFRRVHQRNADEMVELDRMERESLEFHRRVYDGYMQMAQRWPERIRVVDGKREPDIIEAEIREIISKVADEL
jgi:dTMP kinase